MKTLLQIKSSLFSDGGQSSRLAERFVAAWKARHPGGLVIVRDLAADPVPHLDAPRFGAFLAKERTTEQQVVIEYSDRLIDELRRADVVVLGLPMDNLGVPSRLKAYFDHAARAGVTFRYTANGPVGLLQSKKAFVFATRGGMYQGTYFDTQTPYMRNLFGFLGITDVEFVYAEGLTMSEECKREALAQAENSIDSLASHGADAALSTQAS
jgi:FMN-dependent NADH-azoreductase